MLINTSRFGSVEIEPEDILLFSRGMFAFDSHRHWVLLADSDNPAVAWLQSLSDPEVAFPMVSPRRFAPGYTVQIARTQLTPLELSALDQAFVLVPLSPHDDAVTMNLRAPVIINLDRRIGRQVVTNDDQPLQMELTSSSVQLRKSA